MKRKRVLLFLGICTAAVAVAAAVLFARLNGAKEARELSARPFAELRAEDISSAEVHLLPPDITVQITDIEELTETLNDVVIYNKDNSYTEYTGQAVIFTILLTDGKELVVNAYNPFIVIDGVGYKTKYEPCERLSQIANGLIEY